MILFSVLLYFLVLYISSHGGFSDGGKYMYLTEKDEKIRINDLITAIFIGSKKSSVPKIIFVDTCHGGARNYLDLIANEKHVKAKNQSQETIETTKPADERKYSFKSGIETAGRRY
jgi:hypothetical protein